MSKDKELISRLRNKESIRLSDIYDNEEGIESITGNPICKSDENMKVELLGHVELNGVNDFFAYDRDFQPGDTVLHFKGGFYKIIAIGINTETEEKMVVYQSLRIKEYGLDHMKCLSAKWIERNIQTLISHIDLSK